MANQNSEWSFAPTNTPNTPTPSGGSSEWSFASTTPVRTPVSSVTPSPEVTQAVENLPAALETPKTDYVSQFQEGLQHNAVHNFFTGLLDKLNINPGRFLSAQVAEAPSSEQNQSGKPTLTDTYEESHPLSRLDNIFASSIIKGYTGGQIHPQSVEPKTFGEKAAASFSDALGGLSSISSIESKMGGLKTPEALKGFISKYPSVAKYAIPMLEHALKNAPSFIAYGQLDPNLKTITDRLKAAGESASLAGIQSVLSPLPKGASVPLNGIFFSALAKLNGASNQDAAAQGVVGMLFDAISPRLNISDKLTVGKMNDVLGEHAADTINKYSETKITKASTDAEIKKAYAEAIKASHPDLGGSEQEASAVNAARDILLKKQVSKPESIPKEEVIKKEDLAKVEDQVKTQQETVAKTEATKEGDIKVGRHGDIDKVDDGIAHGQTQDKLNPEGRKDAVKLGQEWEKQGVEKIISSDLKRGKETAQIASSVSGAEVEHDPRLKTWDIGEFDGKPKAEVDKQIQYYRDHPTEVVPGGESYGAFTSRIMDAMKDLTARNDSSKTAYVLHNEALKALGHKMEPGEMKSISLEGVKPVSEKTETKKETIPKEKPTVEPIVSEKPTNEFAKIVEGSKTSSEIAKSSSPFGFEFDPQAGFVNTEPIEKAVNNVSEFIKETKKGVKASKDLDDSLYIIQKNAEADRIMAVQLLEKIDLTDADAEVIYHYREDNSLSLTPNQKKIYEESKALRTEINTIANKLKPTIPLSDEDRNSRFVKSKGSVIDRIKSGTKSFGKGTVLGKSAPSLKQRVMKALVDENGNRTVVAIKSGRVMSIKKGELTDIGKMKLRPKQELMEKEIKPLQEKINKTQKLISTLESVKTRDPVSSKKLSNLELRIEALKEYSKQRIAEAKSKNIIKESFQKDIDKSNEKIISLETRLKNLKPFGNVPKVAKAIEKLEVDIDSEYEHETNLSLSDIYEQLTEFADREKNINEKLSKDLTKTSTEFKILSTIPKGEDIVLTKTRIDNAKSKLIDLVNQVSGIEASYSPDELSDKLFVSKDGKRYKIQEATTKEIEANTNLIYHKNFLVNDLVTYLNLRQVERATDFLEEYKNDPKFEEVGIKIGEGEAPSNWKTTVNPSFRGYMLEPHVADVMDKYASSLAKGVDPLRVMTAANQFLRNTIFFNPFIHIPNIGVHWAVERGTTKWVNPIAYKRLVRTGMRAFEAVTKQNQDYIDMLQSGAPLMYSNEQTKNLHNILLAKMETEVEKNPALDFLKKGMKAVNPYVISGKATWIINDMAMMQAIYEHMETHPDHSLERSIKEVSAHIPDYRVPANSAFQFLNNPNVTMFGAYHYGALKSYYEMAKTLATGMSGGEKNTGKAAMKARSEVLGKLLMLGIIMLVIYPELDKAAQAVTGNNDAKFRRAGATTFPYNLSKVISGEQDIGSFIQSVATPASATKELISQIFNHDMFTFQPIRDKGAPAGMQAKQSFMHFLDSIAPVAQFSKVSGGSQTIGQFLASLVGISSPDAVRTKLVDAVNAAQKKVDLLDKDVVNKVMPEYEQAKKAGFDSPEAQAIVDKMPNADYEVYKTLKAVDTAKAASESVDKMRGIVESVHAVGFDSPEAQKIIDKLTDSEYEQYKTAKKIMYPTGGTGADGKGTPADQYIKQRGTVQLISDYAKAFGIDPANAWKALVSKEQLGIVKGNLVGLQRFYGIPFDQKGGSEEYIKGVMKNMGIPYSKRKEYSLEHIVPVMSGGDNSPENLELIDLATHNSYTPFDDALAKAVQGGTMTRKEGAILSKELKIDKKLTVPEAIKQIKK